MHKPRGLWLSMLGVILLGLLFDWAPALAIPAWARKYNAQCALCHYPAVPRLSSYGERFRRAGYRTAEEFTQAPDISKAFDYIAMRTRTRFRYNDPQRGLKKTEFQFNDATFFYAGPLTKNVSTFFELEFEDLDEVVPLAQIVGIWGKPESYASFRIGQMHTITRVGFGGFDRPSGISTNSLFTSNLTTGGVNFRLSRDQRGLEVAYVYKDAKVFGQVLNGLDPNGQGNEGRAFDTDQDKDLLFSYQQIVDDNLSGFALVGYFGRWHKLVNNVPSDVFTFWRVGATGNYLFPQGFELLGGYIRSRDNIPDDLGGGEVEGNAAFVEAQKYFTPSGLTLLARLDWIDPNEELPRDARNIITAGLLYSLQDYLKFTLEGSRVLDNARNNAKDYQVVAEVMLNF